MSLDFSKPKELKVVSPSGEEQTFVLKRVPLVDVDRDRLSLENLTSRYNDKSIKFLGFAVRFVRSVTVGFKARDLKDYDAVDLSQVIAELARLRTGGVSEKEKKSQ